MSKEDIISFLSDMMDALTWRRAGLLFLLCLALVGLAITFDNRSVIFNRFLGDMPLENISVPWQVSEQSKEEMLNIVKTPFVGGVLLTEIDLKKNRRITKFWYVKDATIRQEVAQIVSTLLPQAFFDTDAKNNEQMLAVLSNQFVCSKTEDTIFIRFFPNLTKTYPTVCRLAVPPFSGQFAGLVTLFLVKQPTQSEIDALRIEATQVSTEMYLRDIQNSGRVTP